MAQKNSKVIILHNQDTLGYEKEKKKNHAIDKVKAKTDNRLKS